MVMELRDATASDAEPDDFGVVALIEERRLAQPGAAACPLTIRASGSHGRVRKSRARRQLDHHASRVAAVIGAPLRGSARGALAAHFWLPTVNTHARLGEMAVRRALR